MSPSDEAAVSRFLNALRPLAEMTRASGARAIPLEGSGGGRQSQDYGDAALDAMALYGAPARALRARLARCSAETRLVVERIEAMCHGAPSAVAGLYAEQHGPEALNASVEEARGAAFLASIAHQLSGLAAAAVRKRVARYGVTVETDAEVVRLEGQHRAAHLSAASAHRAAVQALEDWGARAIVAAARELDSIG